jgi:arylsulfatase A-like enzyme
LDHVEPHLPCYPVEQFLKMYDPAAIKPWGNFPDSFTNKPYIQKQLLVNWGLEGLTWEEWARYVQRYLAMISQLDDAIGLVLQGLRQLGIEENTLVIYTADHGDACGGHGMIDKHYSMYEDVTHIPLIMRWPGVIKPGSHCDEFVIHALDLAATLPEAAGVPFECQGRSLLPLLRGQAPPDWRHYAFSTHNGAQFGLYTMRMIRDKRWKYVWNPTDTDELYDLQEDPWEMENRIGKAECAEVLGRLRQDLAADLSRRGDKLMNNWTLSQLKAGHKLGR